MIVQASSLGVITFTQPQTLAVARGSLHTGSTFFCLCVLNVNQTTVFFFLKHIYDDTNILIL